MSKRLLNVCKIDNSIYFSGSVNNRNITKIIRHTNLYNQNGNNSIIFPKINLFINSDGGCILSAFRLIDYIQNSKIPVTTIVDGFVASAATLISISGHGTRYIKPNSIMMMHQLSSSHNGKYSELCDDYFNNKFLMTKMIKLYNEKAIIPNIEELLKKDIYLDSKTCIKYKLAHKLYDDTV